MAVALAPSHQILDKLLESSTEHAKTAPAEVHGQLAQDFRQATEISPDVGASVNQASPVAEASSIDSSQFATPGDQILHHLQMMSERANDISQGLNMNTTTEVGVIDPSSPDNILHSQAKIAEIGGTVGASTDAAKESSQGAESVLKSS